MRSNDDDVRVEGEGKKRPATESDSPVVCTAAVLQTRNESARERTDREFLCREDLKLAPGGHLGCFVIWTKSAFEKLDSVFGTFEKASEKMMNVDLSRIINSDEVQSVVRPMKTEIKRRPLKKNPRAEESERNAEAEPLC
ncbi:hypothetical protein Taro_021469 [Colocasia esculenta]|uniref:Large ribosomal subunit protein uL4 C-terminal domain-containing protein n=1 Tax=Colocasia esculenta TaxID=4460 RepID=A0A843V896_COLES|nr:hypothetical protein [Colocasia esculenta]